MMELAKEYAKVLTSGLFQTHAHWSQLTAIADWLLLACLKLLGGLCSHSWLKKNVTFQKLPSFGGQLSADVAGGNELDIEADCEMGVDQRKSMGYW